MKFKIVCIVALILCVVFFVYIRRDKRQPIFITFANIEGYSYTFKKDSAGNPKTIILEQDERNTYAHWELDIDVTKIEKRGLLYMGEVNIVSQYWVIFNFSGITLLGNPLKASNYNINVIESIGDSVYVYPISQLHYFVE